MFFAPTYHAQRLFSRAAGSSPLQVELRSAQGAEIPRSLAEPDLSAVLSADGKTLRVYAVNSTGTALNFKTALRGFAAGIVAGRRWNLRDSQGSLTPEVLNTRDEPNRVRLFEERMDATGDAFELGVGPFSVTLFELQF